jgi:hypothetical protein
MIDYLDLKMSIKKTPPKSSREEVAKKNKSTKQRLFQQRLERKHCRSRFDRFSNLFNITNTGTIMKRE